MKCAPKIATGMVEAIIAKSTQRVWGRRGEIREFMRLNRCITNRDKTYVPYVEIFS